VATVSQTLPGTGYQHLESDLVLATVERLRLRIDARFKSSGLARVAGELGRSVTEVSDQAGASHARIRRTTALARLASLLVVLAGMFALGLALSDATEGGPERSFDWLPLVESTISNVVYAAIAVLFLWALPERLERRNLLATLHRLRSLAHVIDMHQLGKDPEQLTPSYRPTAQSLPNDLDAEQMHHYFAYCTELLSLVAKTAALCAEHTTDSVVLDTVSTMETLTTDMSSKIWQKIALLPE
jgi:hypothetical protein